MELKYESNYPPCCRCVKYMEKIFNLQHEVENLNSVVISLQGQLVEKQRKKKLLTRWNDDDTTTEDNNTSIRTHSEDSEDCWEYQVFVGGVVPPITYIGLQSRIEEEIGPLMCLIFKAQSYAFAYFADEKGYNRAISSGRLLVQGKFVSFEKVRRRSNAIYF